ncbi:DEXDc domain containing protein [uncultured Caudovirales phage]|uniref:DEXDc domain containing protein n=1 Tax=uncultured Caudovirales phage TaxID=2100421 RepID=A0A6J7XBU9_9CAUD|nr:DEXDc domain containing protein [uncultured Caudovirales phage]CAB4210314.1 DEXDc domain containing protein [uncultured Caudovirales phage]CAB5227288.1 DEXDc domain containing protein [uncultured Caudovirales phage]
MNKLIAEIGLTGSERRIILTSSFVHKEALRAIPGSRWADLDWSLPLCWASCVALRGTFGSQLEIGPHLNEWAGQEKAQRIAPSMLLRTATDLETSFDPRLKPFQRAGVAWLLASSDGALLGDDVGSGKTVQLSVAIRELQHKCGIIVAPKSTLPAWRDHLQDWAGLSSALATGSAAKRRDACHQVADGQKNVLIIAWENVRHHSRLASYGNIALTPEERTPKELNAIKADFVLLDEAHRAKDPRAKMTRACWALGDGPTVKTRYAATATPVANHLDDLWSVMRFVSPKEWPVKSKFVDRYCEMTWNRWGGVEIGGVKPTTSAEFYQILDPRYRSMPKSVVLRDLPPIRGGLQDPLGLLVREAEMSPKQEKAYRQMLDKSVAELETGTLIGAGSLARATRLRQLSASYGDVVDYLDAQGNPRQRLTLMDPSCKLDVLEDMLTGELANEEAVVIFTVSRQLAQMAAERAERVTGKKAGLIIGGQSDDERESVLRSFQAGELGSVAVTVAAGGAGITLTKARVAIFLQRDFSYVNNYQAEGRVHRIGSEVHDRVLIYDVITPNTLEDRVLEVLRNKEDLAGQIKRTEDLLALYTGF